MRSSQAIDRPAAVSGSAIPRTNALDTRAYLFGDYDDDDYTRGRSYDDGDSDDSDKPGDRDGDIDSVGGNGSYYDSDDSGVRHFGHAASQSDRRIIAALVKRYYDVAVAGDGAKACALIDASLADSIPQELGDAGPHYLRGLNTCAEILSKMFEQNHLQLSTYAAKLQITGVRLSGTLGLVILGFKTVPGRQIEVIHDHGIWKMYSLLDHELP
jgi:hypothetical protein